MIWTTNTEVSQRITELIGEQDTYFKGQLIDVAGVGTVMGNLPRYTLSELAPVLKKIGENCKDEEMCPTCGYIYDGSWWLYHYLKVCEIVATDGDANAYLLELLEYKPN